MMQQIRYVKIPLAEARTEPDTHVAYALNVQGPVKSWTVWHRYSDFLTLEYELTREFPGVTIPATLPPKTLTSWFSKIASVTSISSTDNNASQLELVEERKRDLERYIQSMIMSEDGRWRSSAALQRFLAPVGRGAKQLAAGSSGADDQSTSSFAGETTWVTAASWLNDHRDAEQTVREVRQCIMRRENALTRNEVSVSHQCLLEAKRKLADLSRIFKSLDQGLEQISSTLTSGELLRRQDMVSRLAEERSNLSQLVLGTSMAATDNSDRAALLSGSSAGEKNQRLISRAGISNHHRMPGSMPVVQGNGAASNGSRSRRIFGNSNPPQETNETRGRDSHGLLQLQEQRMADQDQMAAQLSSLVRRQREMGETIGNELELHNQMLAELDQDMDRTGNKLASARRQANRL